MIGQYEPVNIFYFRILVIWMKKAEKNF